MTDYKVLVTELLQKTVMVSAASEEEAKRRCEDAWQNAEITLDARNFSGAEFHVIGEADGSESEKMLEVVEQKGGAFL